MRIILKVGLMKWGIEYQSNDNCDNCCENNGCNPFDDRVDERSTYESVMCIECLIDGVRCLRDAILGGIMKNRDWDLNTASNGNIIDHLRYESNSMMCPISYFISLPKPITLSNRLTLLSTVMRRSRW